MLQLLIPIISNVLDRVLPGDSSAVASKKLEIQSELVKAIAQQDSAQLAVNQVEAASQSIFVAGWRPFIGWTCGIGFIYTVLLQPLLSWIAMIYGIPLPPVIASDLFMSVMLGMLGLGGLRSLDKYTGKETRNIKILK